MNEKLNSSIDKTLSILEFVSRSTRGVSLAEIVKVVGIPKTTAFRILDVLLAREYVAWDQDSERYSIGLKTVEVGLSGLIGQDIVEVSIPYLRELATTVGETSFLAVYNNGDVVYLYKAEGNQAIVTTATLGSRRPAYCTALGKAILANLPIEEADRIFEKPLEKLTEKSVVDRMQLHEEFAHIRMNGYSIDDEGIEVGLYCLAVPIYNYTGGVVAAISVSGPVKRFCDNKERIVEELKHVGAMISRRLGYVRAMRGV
ncbi:IclR family transcriptional regulator [Propionivibrio soli]|jgi:DNA-binding IclR family transcriptional regulator|uniref:IclR family transcriptional regulator n=1 Tax=Propionivibrio soli TaxID=2976531 RepID=UPI0021E8FB4E|nr:IclR family transcriptional regulator [Propionivibrio soli]